jgi:hypothetical protein
VKVGAVHNAARKAELDWAKFAQKYAQFVAQTAAGLRSNRNTHAPKEPALLVNIRHQQ